MASSVAILADKVRDFPDKPGVYLMKNARKKIIYIGKARSLKKRVRSYLSGEKDLKTRVLMGHAVDVEIIITNNEYEAFLLENNLIKQWHPQFNIDLKDGKSYPVIRITPDEYPRIFRTRRIVFDGSLYFGPYPNAGQLDAYLKVIEKLFPLRKCRGKLKPREHPCLYYHIGRCAAPCCGLISREEYLAQVGRIKKLLSGRTKALINELSQQMRIASGDLDFEKAARFRDQIETVGEIAQGQQVVDRDLKARDYLGYVEKDTLASFAVLQMRNGKLVGREIFRVEVYSKPKDALSQFLVQYYSKTHNPPAVVHLPKEAEEAGSLSAYLSEHLSQSISLKKTGARGGGKNHRKILQMARENAEEDILERDREKRYIEDLESLRTALHMHKLPRRVEGFDISHLAGQDTVASMVSFLNGRPDKGSYRYFKLRTLDGKIDDYEAMREIIARRYTRVVNEELEKPDLILVDGGKGQVSAASSVLMALGLSQIPLAGLAKEHEAVYLPSSDIPIMFEENSRALKVLQAVRDESHRFATGYQKRLRARRLGVSVLEEVRGIGKRRSQKLLRTFGTLQNILRSSPEDVAKRAGISIEVALGIHAHLERRISL
jgi:excinuclease ABC subunit C